MTRSKLARGLWGVALLLALGGISGCTLARFDFGNSSPFGQPSTPEFATSTLPLAAGESFGTGPVRVALLLPLTGAVADVGISMSNGAKLAMSFIEANPNIAENITIVLRDTGDSPGMAAQQAEAAIAEGASLILGPLRADQVAAAGAVAKSAGIPLIGFSNTSAVAQPGVYLLNVLPEAEAQRSLAFVQAQGRRGFAGIFPANDFGRAQEAAFRRAAAALNIQVAAVYSYTSQPEAEALTGQVSGLVQQGVIDTLFMPDRATAPALAASLAARGVPSASLTLIGSADWSGDTTIPRTPALLGAVFPAVDEAGYNAILPEYQQRFMALPHRFATLAYTATILANASSLSMATPRYDRAQLTMPGGFNGRDGVFRFTADGRSDYALVMKQVAVGGAVTIDGPKL